MRPAPLTPLDNATREARSLARSVAAAHARRTGDRSLILEVDKALSGPERNTFVHGLLARAGGGR
jgi:hypothetical protein